MKFNILIMVFSLFVGALFAKEMSGVVTNYNNLTKEVEFKDAKADYKIKLDGNSKEIVELRKLLSDPSAKKKPMSYNIPDSLILSQERVPFGVRSDCSEIDISIDQLNDLAKKSSTLLDFLQNIPGGTLQGFTFFTNTRSLQRGEGDHLVDEKNPRLIRGSIDGKITISFVCHPEQKKHNTVEIMYVDEEDQDKIKTLSYNFNAKSGEGIGDLGENKRVHHAPTSCVTCHATTPKNGEPGSAHLKLNWPEYFFWGDCDTERGITMFGMSDDIMGNTDYRPRQTTANFDGCTPGTDKAAHEKLKQSFADLQERAKTDECLKTLPWAEMPTGERVGIEKGWSDEDYAKYPYANGDSQKTSDDGTRLPDAKQDPWNYSLRTNTRFTDVYSHRTAKRNYQILKNNPNYEKFKLVLAMESLRTCLSNSDRQRMGKLLGLKNIPPISDDPKNPDSFPLFKSFASEIVGFGTSDFTMHPPPDLTSNPRADTATYNGVIFSDSVGDHAIHDVTLGHVLEDVAETSGNQTLKRNKNKLLVDGVGLKFGSRFSCIDELGRGVSRNTITPTFLENSESACNILKRKFDEQSKDLVKTKNIPSRPVLKPNCEGSTLVVDKIDIDQLTDNEILQVRAGRDLAKSCTTCHSAVYGDHERAFITSNPTNANDIEIVRLTQYSRASEFWSKINGHLSGSETPRMPIGCSGETCFNKMQRKQLLAYLKSLTDERYFRDVEKPTRSDCAKVNSNDTSNPSNDGTN